MEEGLLSKKQRNEVFRILESKGINPACFELVERPYPIYTITGRPLSTFNCHVLRHRDGFYYKFNNDGTVFNLEFSPDRYGNRKYDSVIGWATVRSKFESWTEWVSEDINEPDLWAEAFKGISSKEISDTQYLPGTQFSQLQIEQIKQKLDGIRDQVIKELKPTAEQIAIINDNIEHLKLEAEKQSIKNWYFMAMGSLMSTATSIVLSPEMMPIYVNIIHRAFTGIRGLLGG